MSSSKMNQARNNNVTFQLNSRIHPKQIQRIKHSGNKNYYPKKGFPLNRTAFHFASGTYAQLETCVNICDIVVDNDKHFESFKNYLLEPTVNFMVSSIKQFASAQTANEMGFKINIYVPNENALLNEKWFVKLPNSVMRTSLGANLNVSHSKFSLRLQFDDNFNINDCSSCPAKQNALYKDPNIYSTSTAVGNQSFGKETFGNESFGNPTNQSFGTHTFGNQTATGFTFANETTWNNKVFESSNCNSNSNFGKW